MDPNRNSPKWLILALGGAVVVLVAFGVGFWLLRKGPQVDVGYFATNSGDDMFSSGRYLFEAEQPFRIRLVARHRLWDSQADADGAFVPPGPDERNADVIFDEVIPVPRACDIFVDRRDNTLMVHVEVVGEEPYELFELELAQFPVRTEGTTEYIAAYAPIDLNESRANGGIWSFWRTLDGPDGGIQNEELELEIRVTPAATK